MRSELLRNGGEIINLALIPAGRNAHSLFCHLETISVFPGSPRNIASSDGANAAAGSPLCPRRLWCVPDLACVRSQRWSRVHIWTESRPEPVCEAPYPSADNHATQGQPENAGMVPDGSIQLQLRCLSHTWPASEQFWAGKTVCGLMRSHDRWMLKSLWESRPVWVWDGCFIRGTASRTPAEEDQDRRPETIEKNSSSVVLTGRYLIFDLLMEGWHSRPGWSLH